MTYTIAAIMSTQGEKHFPKQNHQTISNSSHTLNHRSENKKTTQTQMEQLTIQHNGRTHIRDKSKTHQEVQSVINDYDDKFKTYMSTYNTTNNKWEIEALPRFEPVEPTRIKTIWNVYPPDETYTTESGQETQHRVLEPLFTYERYTYIDESGDIQSDTPPSNKRYLEMDAPEESWQEEKSTNIQHNIFSDASSFL